MIKLGKYDVIQTGSFLLNVGTPLSILCDGMLLEIAYEESNESSLTIKGDFDKSLLIQTIPERNTYSHFPYLIGTANGKEYYIGFIISPVLDGRRNLTFNLLRN